MSWLNITRNIEDYGEEAIGWLVVQNDLWAITTSGVAPNMLARIRKKINADGSSQAWQATYTGLPTAVEYGITGFAEDTEENRLYIANGPTGEIFYNITGNPQDDWDKLLDKTYGGFHGAAGNIKDLIFYNKKVYLAHKGGVSVMDAATRTWSLVGDFTEGFDGVGQCHSFYVLNNELYVTVAFGDLGIVFKYHAETLSLKWNKVVELPSVSIHPEYITSRNNIIFCTDDSTGQNVFNGEGIDTTLTGQPRFTQSTHLAGVPSSMHTYSEDNFIYVTCEDQGLSEKSDAYTDNLITSVKQLIPDSAVPGETFISSTTREALNDYTTNSSLYGGDYFMTTRPNPNYTIKFAIQTNKLEFLPGETYTIVWEYGFASSFFAKINGTSIQHAGSSTLTAGFKSTAGTKIDANSPKEYYTDATGNLFTSIRGEGTKTNTRRYTFTFRADKLATTTNKQFRIEGTISIGIKSSYTYDIPPFFMANALVKSLKVYRGNKEIANAQYIDAQYSVKTYSNIPEHEKENHSIGEPSPPDQWFIKFPATGEATPTGVAGTSELSMISTRGGFTPNIQPGEIIPDPEPPPPPTDINKDDGGTDNSTDTEDTNDGVNDGGTTIIDSKITPTFATKLSRLLVTNRINLQPNSIYRFHAIVNRVKNSNADNVLKIRINPSLDALKPSFDGTISTTGIQFPIEWELDTTGISAADLRGVYFQIDSFEENIDIANASAVYISDVNILGKINELPINTIYRYDGEVWDNAITQISDDGTIVNESPHSLIESYEVNSNVQRLYCISGGNIYVWGLGIDDPYGGIIASRIVVSW